MPATKLEGLFRQINPGPQPIVEHMSEELTVLKEEIVRQGADITRIMDRVDALLRLIENPPPEPVTPELVDYLGQPVVSMGELSRASWMNRYGLPVGTSHLDPSYYRKVIYNLSGTRIVGAW